jgi:hypothetical protein
MMASIDKICEYSGDYPGWRMWGYKRNHIQVCPQYRKLFRGADAEIVIVSRKRVILLDHGGVMDYYPNEAEWMKSFLMRGRLVTEYLFYLKVSDEKLRGEVDGEYYNWTTDLKDTHKRLKRMLRCRNLKIISKD